MNTNTWQTRATIQNTTLTLVWMLNFMYREKYSKYSTNKQTNERINKLKKAYALCDAHAKRICINNATTERRNYFYMVRFFHSSWFASNFMCILWVEITNLNVIFALCGAKFFPQTLFSNIFSRCQKIPSFYSKLFFLLLLFGCMRV